MAANLGIGDQVWVPKTRLHAYVRGSSSMALCEVVRRYNNSVDVEVHGATAHGDVGPYVQCVSSNLCHRDPVGILVLEVGDFDSELDLLDPLALSVTEFLKILHGQNDRLVVFQKMRSLGEIKRYWDFNHAIFRYVVLVGHGEQVSRSSFELSFGNEGSVESREFVNAFLRPGQPDLPLVGLCCQTGRATFAKAASSNSAFDVVIGPQGDLHGAAASQFAQTFFSWRMLEGYSVKRAFNRAHKSVPGRAHLCMWRNGSKEKVT